MQARAERTRVIQLSTKINIYALIMSCLTSEGCAMSGCGNYKELRIVAGQCFVLKGEYHDLLTCADQNVASSQDALSHTVSRQRKPSEQQQHAHQCTDCVQTATLLATSCAARRIVSVHCISSVSMFSRGDNVMFHIERSSLTHHSSCEIRGRKSTIKK